MKRLAVLRHAKSSWHAPQADDLDRPLNERGRKAAKRMGRELKMRGFAFDCAIASPARRVRETIERFAGGYGVFHFPIRFEQGIYMADSGALLDIVRTFPDTCGTALLIGHNPGLERLIVTLADDDPDGLRARVAKGLPTAAFAMVELPWKSWNDAAPGSGTIGALILPRELD
jgi:phosphohistidine phosphatase